MAFVNCQSDLLCACLLIPVYRVPETVIIKKQVNEIMSRNTRGYYDVVFFLSLCTKYQHFIRIFRRRRVAPVQNKF
jgi:hypothetical protein